MKKYLSVLLCILIVFLTACSNSDNNSKLNAHNTLAVEQAISAIDSYLNGENNISNICDVIESIEIDEEDKSGTIESETLNTAWFHLKILISSDEYDKILEKRNELATKIGAKEYKPKKITTKASPTESSSKSSITYESILDEYSKKIKDATPKLISEYKGESKTHLGDITALAELNNAKISKLAEISNEGVSKMSELMISINSDYDTYTLWANKLMDVYMDEATKITDAYMESALQ